jgi:hypothetical protein
MISRALGVDARPCRYARRRRPSEQFPSVPLNNSDISPLRINHLTVAIQLDKRELCKPPSRIRRDSSGRSQGSRPLPGHAG